MENGGKTPPFEFGSTAAPIPGGLRPVPTPKFLPTLVCFEGPPRGTTFSLTRAQTLIGRSPGADILLHDAQASRSHCLITYNNWLDASQKPECWVEDLQSRNGTELNGKPLTTKIRLKERDRLQVGSCVFVFTIKDESEIQLQKSLFDQATKDPLTGLSNRRAFEAQLAHFVSHGAPGGRYPALLILDADRFKSVNDTYGHDVGDQVLMHIAGVIRGACRALEVAARWGGEEFVVLLPECDAEGAIAAGERMRQAIEAAPVPVPTGLLSVTVSVGGSVMRPDDTQDSFFRRADQQLLRAKESGRNRVCVGA